MDQTRLLRPLTSWVLKTSGNASCTTFLDKPAPLTASSHGREDTFLIMQSWTSFGLLFPLSFLLPPHKPEEYHCIDNLACRYWEAVLECFPPQAVFAPKLNTPQYLRCSSPHPLQWPCAQLIMFFWYLFLWILSLLSSVDTVQGLVNRRGTFYQ